MRPSLEAMPALSWPRCCSAYRPKIREIRSFGVAVDGDHSTFFVRIYLTLVSWSSMLIHEVLFERVSMDIAQLLN